MQEHITPSRIANSILLDRGFEGINILLEGEKDIKLYGKLVDRNIAKLKVTYGKKKMREVYSILQEQQYDRVIGIRDADFIRLNGNEKFDSNYKLNLFLTDCHDSEGMILNSSAFDDFMLEIVSREKLELFSEKYGDFKELIYSLAYPLSCLRLANKKYNLGLSFKPASVNGNILKFKGFICDKTFTYLGHDKLINSVVEYSKNRGAEISQRSYIKEKLLEIIDCNHAKLEMLNGHDLAEIIYILCKKGLRSNNDSLNDASSVEIMLRLAYSKANFVMTLLYESLHEWQKENPKLIIIN
ncbi:hypothetical protein [Atlantibacter subterraneus]|uniref:hypothetical protein n=1 Tax=Atlantibacter subterraneus TaxID=255519 RepID=UPI0022EB28FB|nr:hypothetical protein [Atlantibacter subterranea]MDA3134906.1 hypothetical protein [Atlantibacter subterranea]